MHADKIKFSYMGEGQDEVIEDKEQKKGFIYFMNLCCKSLPLSIENLNMIS